jgi:hypothetical protein
MAPKTHFKVPLNKASDTAAPTARRTQATRTSEKIPLQQLLKQGTSSKASHPLYNEPTNAEETLPLHENMETYPLRSIDLEDDAEDIGSMDNSASPSNVSFMIPLCIIPFITIFQTPMGSMASNAISISASLAGERRTY